MPVIDLNSDLGESFGAWRMGDDEAMLDVVTSANIACGFHAGDPAGILRTLRMAARSQVVVGAHVGYPDLVGFGRRTMNPSTAELFGDVAYQIGALQGLATAAGTKVSYVKPHGALYNTIAEDRRQAEDVFEAIKAVDPSLPLVVLAGAPIVTWAREAGLRIVAEAFADRAYTSQGRLVPRDQAGSVLHDPQSVAQRMLRLVTDGIVEAIDGTPTRIDAGSVCVHGDNPAAVDMARTIRTTLERAGVTVAPFAKTNEKRSVSGRCDTDTHGAQAGDGVDIKAPEPVLVVQASPR